MNSRPLKQSRIARVKLVCQRKRYNLHQYTVMKCEKDRIYSDNSTEKVQEQPDRNLVSTKLNQQADN